MTSLYRLRHHHDSQQYRTTEFHKSKGGCVSEGKRVARAHRTNYRWHAEPRVDRVTIRSTRSPRVMMWKAVNHMWDTVEVVWRPGGAP